MWARVFQLACGLWLTVAPAFLSYPPGLARVARVAGPLCASFAVIAMGEVTRGVRWMIAPCVMWMLTAVAAAAQQRLALDALLVSLLALAACPAPGRVRDHYGGGWANLFR